MPTRYILILSLMISFFTLHAQKTKKKTEIFGKGGVEVFYVNVEDQRREGSYLLSSSYSRPLITGFYSGGLKDSVWIYYKGNGSGHQILSKQHYRKGVRTGVWEFYEDNALAWTYDFDSSKVNFIQPEDATTIADTYPSYQDEHNNRVNSPPEKHALPISSDYTYVLLAYLRYPDEAMNQNQQGEVMVGVLVDQQGNPESYEIGISSGYHALDAEALRVVKLTHLEFVPAENNGVKVKSLVLKKVGFHMEFH